MSKRCGISLIFALIILIVVIFVFIKVINKGSKTQPIIITKLGKIMGITINRLGKELNCYYGVPYAEPPIGPLRFNKPIPKKPWNDLLKATKQPNYCWQRSTNHWRENNDMKKMFKYAPDWEKNFDNQISEDCLYLNIYSPITTSHKTNLTVMVWIHGGSFQGGHIGLYDGSTLAVNNDVIIVTINYRLGIFGFLSAVQPELSGNYGLHDQVMAFKWIKENIHSFGGNPNNIVIFGESAGGMSVGYHLISPLSDDLFSRAIMQSGNALVPITIVGKEAQRNATIDVIKGTLCPLPPNISENSSQPLDNSSFSCLRQVNASVLFELYKNIQSHRFGVFVPTVDEDFFPEDPFKMVKDRKFNSNKEILIGANAMEGAYYGSYGPVRTFYSGNKISENFTKENLIKTMKQNSPKDYRDYVEMIVNYYMKGIEDENNPIEVWNRYIRIVGDVIFVCPDYLFINEYSLSNRTVYYYQFKHKPSFFTRAPKWAKSAVHGDEVSFVFGFPLLFPKLYSLEEIKLSESMMNVWTQFAKNGKPLCCNSWIKYQFDEPFYMSLDVGHNGCQMKPGFPGYKCENYETFLGEISKYIKSADLSVSFYGFNFESIQKRLL